MTVIRAACASCGPVDLGPADIALWVCENRPACSFYAFTCLTCSGFNRKPADDHIVGMLVDGGVPALAWTVPAEAAEVHTGPALSYDDLLDFHLALRGADALAGLVGAA